MINIAKLSREGCYVLDEASYFFSIFGAVALFITNGVLISEHLFKYEFMFLGLYFSIAMISYLASALMNINEQHRSAFIIFSLFWPISFFAYIIMSLIIGGISLFENLNTLHEKINQVATRKRVEVPFQLNDVVEEYDAFKDFDERLAQSNLEQRIERERKCIRY